MQFNRHFEFRVQINLGHVLGQILDQDEKKSTELHARRPALIVLTLMVLMQIGGINAVLFYLKDIFLKADTGYSPGLQTVIVSIFQVS